MNLHSQVTSKRRIRKRIAEYDPDVIVSVHPTMTNVPQKCVIDIKKETGKDIPIFTVVTDLGSGHATWFTRRMEKIFVASSRMSKLARVRGWVSRSKLVECGLPIRKQFGEKKTAMGKRGSEPGKEVSYRL